MQKFNGLVHKLREVCAILRGAGYSAPEDLPIAVLWSEYDIAVRIKKTEMATNMVMLQGALGALLSKEAAKSFAKNIKEMLAD